MDQDVSVTDKHVLPSMEYSFDYSGKGTETGINWVGKFEYKRPSIGARSRIEVFNAQLNGDLFTIDEATQLLNKALAHLRYTIIKFPAWFKESSFGQDLYDRNVIIEIYTKCIDFETKWKEQVHSGKPEDVKADSELPTAIQTS